MAEKDLTYRLNADIAAFEAQFRKASRSAEGLSREFKKMEDRQAKVHAAMQQVGQGMLVASGAIAAGLGLAVKAAIEWESAWAGVAKVVSGTPEQLDALEQELRSLTDILPASHQEIAQVAAAAGQLGIARKDLAEFTRTMIDLGVSTNLSAEEAAFALARMQNIMKTAPEDVRRLGSTIVDLGNNSATTEAEIVAMSLRIAGAGNIIGLSESDVLAFSAALSSVGINAEAGGSAISLFFNKIDAAVSAGGEKLQSFAEVAGMSAEEFKAAYEQDAAGAINTFVVGLGRINQAGGDVFGTLDSLGLSGIRLRDALLRLSGSGDVLAKSLKIGNDAWEDNNALTKEAERRYETTEARMQMARNKVNDFAISMGQTLLPAVGAVVDFLGAFADVVGGLPGPLKTIITVVAALAAGILLVGGAAMIAVPQFAAMRAAMDQIAAAGGRAAAGVGLLRMASSGIAGFLTGPWGIAFFAAAAALTVFAAKAAESRAETKELAGTLEDVSGAVTRDTRLWIANQLAKDGLIDQAKRMGVSTKDLMSAIEGEEAALKRLRKATEDYSEAQEGDISGTGLAAAEREKLRVRVEELNQKLKEARKHVKDVADASGEAGDEMSNLDPATRGMAEGFGLSADKAEELADEISDLDKALKALHDEIFGLEEAEDALTESFQRAKEAAKENGAGIRGNSKAAIENRKNLRDLVKAHEEHLVAMRKNGASAKDLQAAHAGFRRQLIAVLRSMGLSKKEAVEYANRLNDIPRTVATNVKVDTSGAMARVAALRRALNQLGLTARNIRVGGGVTGRGGFTERWGGVIAARNGLVTPAHIARGQMIRYAEPETGGEAFIPKHGNRQRNLDILNIAAGWNGMALHPVGARQVMAGPTYNVTVQAWTDRFSWPQFQQQLRMAGAI